MHLAAFLNQNLNEVPEIEPNQNHDNEASKCLIKKTINSNNFFLFLNLLLF
jgi:hypothetical protein